MTKIPVGLINWNAIEITEQCVRQIHAHTDRMAIHVLVIDNASRDPANQRGLRQLHAAGHIDEVIFSETNLGFAGAFNVLMDRTRGPVFSYVSNDCHVESGWLEAGLRTLGSDDGVAAACANVYEDPAQRGFRPDQELGQLYGPIMFIRRAAWQVVGSFDVANFSPAYSEELDWSYRAIRKGFRLKLAGGSMAYHIGGYSCEKNVSRPEIHRLRLTHRIKCRLFNWSFIRLFVTSWRLYLGELITEVRQGTFSILLQAFWNNMCDISHIKAERRKRFSA